VILLNTEQFADYWIKKVNNAFRETNYVDERFFFRFSKVENPYDFSEEEFLYFFRDQLKLKEITLTLNPFDVYECKGRIIKESENHIYGNASDLITKFGKLILELKNSDYDLKISLTFNNRTYSSVLDELNRLNPDFSQSLYSLDIVVDDRLQDDYVEIKRE
jgi:hypothetical protein